MLEFADRAREALADKGMSMRKAAGVLHYDVSYLSRVLNGKQSPSAQLAEALDQLLGTNGELRSLVGPVQQRMNRTDGDGSVGSESDIEHLHSAMRHLLHHARSHGADMVAGAAVQEWKAAQRKLDTGSVPESCRREYLSVVAELAEVAGWLLFDSGDVASSRSALLDSNLLARHAGDRSMGWFTMDLIAMADIHAGQPAEALRIADEIGSALRVPPRVTLLSQIRKARALALMGDRTRTMSELDKARGGVSDSITARDPAWAWWVDERELTGHEGEALLALGDFDAAAERINRALDISRDQLPTGRNVMYYSATLLHALARTQAWSDCEPILNSLPPLLESIRSGRNRGILRRSLRQITRSPDAPRWVADLAHDVEELPQMLAA